MKIRHVNFARIVGGILLGFVSRVMYEQIRSSTELESEHLFVDDLQSDCPACHIDDVCPLCPPTKISAETPAYVAEPYKPKGMYEVTRWLYFDEDHIFDIINDESKIELMGHWREEVRAVTQIAMEYVNSNNMLGQKWTLVRLHDGYMRTDSLRGTDYMMDLLVKPTTLNFSRFEHERIFRVRMVHPLESFENAKKLSVKKEIQNKINLVVPVPPDSEYIEEFIDQYAKEIHDKQVELILVLFTGANNDESRKTKELITNKISSDAGLPIQLLVQEGPFNYFDGVHMGTNAARPSDLVLAIGDDMSFSATLLHHCRAMAVAQKQAYFPVAFAQFNPDVIERGMPPGKPKNVNKMEHSKFTGYWTHETHDYICAYQSDLLKILSGLKMAEKQQPNTGLGNWIYVTFLRNDIEVVVSVEPHLYKRNNKNQCENHIRSEYKWCLREKAKSLGSKPALGILYINEVIQKQAKKP